MNTKKNINIVDKFDDTKIIRFTVENFEKLPLRQKKLIYCLSQAALCGRDIITDQNYSHNLEIRTTLEKIYTQYRGDKQCEEFLELEKYLKKIWFANGIHHHYSSDKFSPGFSAEFFAEQLETLTQKPSPKTLQAITAAIFDPTIAPKRSSQNQQQDLIENSAVNFYENITQAEVEEYYNALTDPSDTAPLPHGLNTKIVKNTDGQIQEIVWKIGGMYSRALEATVQWLEKAAAVAENTQQKDVILELIEHYKTGSLDHYNDFNLKWVQENHSKIDFINGFTETYADPLGRKATWESVVHITDKTGTERTQKIAQNAQWFEDHSPVDPQFKKEQVKGVSAKVINVAVVGGDCYPGCPLGINLPNADWIRELHGSKSVTLANIATAHEKAATGNGFNPEFIPDPTDQKRREIYGATASTLHTDLHECLGHGSGKLAPETTGDELKNYGAPLEEARADLFALYYIADPKLQELGIVENDDVWKTAYYQQILNGALTQTVRIELGQNIEQAHMRNRAMIANWALEIAAETAAETADSTNSEKAVEMYSVGQKTYIRINNYTALRKIFAQQLREVQRIKSCGDYTTAATLFEKHGIKIDQKLHAEILSRYSALGIEPYTGFINPTYKTIEKDGEITDITIDYTQSYTEQMLEYSRKFGYGRN